MKQRSFMSPTAFHVDLGETELVDAENERSLVSKQSGGSGCVGKEGMNLNTLRLTLIIVAVVLWPLFPVTGSQAQQASFGRTAWHTGILEAPSTCPSPGWTMPRVLAGHFVDARFSQIAVDLNGAAHVVWSGRQGTSGSAVYYAKLHPYRDQQRQQDEMENLTLLSDTGHIAQQPRIVVDVWGYVHVVWEDLASPSSRGEIFYRRRDPWTGKWTKPEPENVSKTNGWSEIAQIRVDPYGVIHVVWIEHTEAESRLFYAYKPFQPLPHMSPEEEWQSEDLTDSLGATVNAVPAVPAYDPITSFSKTFHLVWVSDDGDIIYASRDQSGRWGKERVSGTSGTSTDPALVIDSSGRPHLVWSDETSGPADIYFASRDASGNWVAQNISNSTQDSITPQLALAGQDRSYVIWVEEGEIFFTRGDGSGNWLTPENISRTPAYSSDPHIAVSYWGDTHVIWEDDGILYNRRGSFGDWPAAVRLDCAVDNTWQLDATLDSLGRVHVVWIGTSAGDDKVWRSRTLLTPSYQPGTDGFSFENPDETTREWEMFRQFFGRDQVEFLNGAHRPIAQETFDTGYRDDIGGGGCVGMATGSGLHYWQAEQRLAGDYRIPPPMQDFWARLVDAPRDVVSSTVSYYHGAQSNCNVVVPYDKLGQQDYSPSWQYRLIQRYLDNGIPVLVRIEHDSRLLGHLAHMMLVYDVITPPYGNIGYLRVYDPNNPQDNHRQVEVDLLADTWSYDWNPIWTWVGGRWSGTGDRNILSFHPITVFLKPGILTTVCRASDGTALHMVSVNGPARPLFVDNQGRRFGYVGDTFVKEIPNAFVFPVAGQGSDPIPDESYFLPLSSSYMVNLFGEEEGTVDFSLFSDRDPGLALYEPIAMMGVEGIHVAPGTQHQLRMDDRGVSFISAHVAGETVSLVLGTEADISSTIARVSGVSLSAGQQITVSLGYVSEVPVRNTGGETSYDVALDTVGENAGQFRHAHISIGSGDTHTLWANWLNLTTSQVRLEIDRGSDGTIDEIQELPNQAGQWHIYLPMVWR